MSSAATAGAAAAAAAAKAAKAAAAGAASAATRGVRRVMPAPPRHWVGNGFHVYPVFERLAFTEEVSPWLMFDYAAPKDFPPAKRAGERRGVGRHPHRGFETVTIAFQGEVEHADSTGNRDVIGPGDVQWMTAGRGIVHEEFHSEAFAASGGTFEMCQLWLNLPAAKKMTKPNYQPILAGDIPEVALPAEGGAGGEAGSVRVIAGSYGGAAGPARTHSPVELWAVALGPKGAFSRLELPDSHNVVVFVRRGEVLLGAEGEERVVKAQGVALMERGGAGGEGATSSVRLAANQRGTQVLLLAGEPLDEPIAAQGPFVMNTQKQLHQAMDDYYSGKMGR